MNGISSRFLSTTASVDISLPAGGPFNVYPLTTRTYTVQLEPPKKATSVMVVIYRGMRYN